MKVLVLVVCLAAAAAAQLHPHGHIAGHTAGLAAGHGLLAAGQGAVSVHEQVYHTSAQPESLVQFQQFGKSVQQQVPLTGYQQTTLVTGQPASYFKTVQNIENPVLLNGEVQKFEKIEKIANVQKVELPAVTAYSGGYEQSAYIQKQPALASLSGYKSVASYQKPVETIYKKEVVTPAVSSYSAFPAATAYKQESFVAAKPAVASYSAFPAVSTYKKESFVAAKPAVSSYSAYSTAPAYKQESLLVSKPAVASYSAFPAASAYKQESFVAAKPAVSSYSAYSTAPAYKQESLFVSKPAVATSTYKQESFVAAKPAVTSYSAYSTAPAYKQESLLVSKPAVSSYSAFPAATAYKQESVFAAKPAVASYKQESLFAAKPAVASYGAAFPSAMYGGSAMFPGYSQSAEGASSILKLYKDDIGTGDYQYGYATSNGISHDEQGKVSADSRSSEGSTAVSGSYSYTGPDGVSYTVKYIADEQGFRAFGDHLPKLSEEAQHAIDESAKYAEQKDY